MKAALHAVFWEILWKNRVVFPALAVLLGLGAALAWFASQADPSAQWLNSIRTLTVMTFLISLFIGFAPFTLMESSGGWRMNSMITRWFALPMPTVQMVFFPLVAACGFICLLVTVWMPVLNRIAPGLDAIYLAAVLSVGQLAMNTVAWTVPRKPLQYWVAAGLVFPAVLILAFAPQEGRNEQFRHGMLIPLSYVGLLLAGWTWFAASRNRSGAFPGELPLDRVWQLLRGGAASARGREYRSPETAMFSAESLPNLRLVTLSWYGLALALFIYISLQIRGSYIGNLSFNLRVLPLICMGMLPVLGIVWMAVWGLCAGGEPAALFRSRLSSFRSTLPVSCGLLAAQRIAMLFLGWCLIWLPLLGVSYFYTPEITGIPTDTPQVVQATLARFMALGAFVLVGALPLYLWGRFEGFPNFLLAGVCAWGLSWGIASNLRLESYESPGWRWALLGALLALKAVAAISAFVLALRNGHITWRFPVFLLAGWLAVVAVLVWLLPTWKSGGLWAALYLPLLVPLARLAWCPLAIAANRHR